MLLLVPQVLVDVFLQHLLFILELLDLLPTLDIESHFQQLPSREVLLQADVEPDHVAVTVDRVIFRLHTGHIVHARTPTAGPVGSVSPGMVQLEPFVVSAQGREDPVQAVEVAELFIIDDLAPGDDIGTGAGRVVTLEAVGAIRLDLATDEAVRMLLGVEIVQRALEREEAGAVAGEHHHEGGIPHENIAVVGDIKVARYETRAWFRCLDIADGDLPRFPVHLDRLLMAAPGWVWQNLPGLLECAGLDRFRLGGTEGILGNEWLLQVGILVRQAVFGLIRLGFILRESRAGNRSCAGCQQGLFQEISSCRHLDSI